MTRTLAIDVECVPTTDEPDFDDPGGGAWEVFAIALSFRPTPPADHDTAVLVRQNGSARARRKLLCAMANWILDHRPIDDVVGYNSESFDMPIINHHIDQIEQTDDELAGCIRATLDEPHRDLFDDIRARLAPSESWPSLEQALRERGIDSPVTTMDEEIVDGSLMPAIGNRILSGEQLGEHERDALEKYAASDVFPLHELADALDEERRERIESEAAAITRTGQSATNTEGQP